MANSNSTYIPSSQLIVRNLKQSLVLNSTFALFPSGSLGIPPSVWSQQFFSTLFEVLFCFLLIDWQINFSHTIFESMHATYAATSVSKCLKKIESFYKWPERLGSIARPQSRPYKQYSPPPPPPPNPNPTPNFRHRQVVCFHGKAHRQS